MSKRNHGKTATSIRLMRRGWTTAIQSALAGGALALSQRVGELRRAGAPVIDKWVRTDGGALVKAYKLPRK